MKDWKRVIYLVCLIQVGAGIALMGVMSFLPLFLSELGLSDPGESAFWAGLITGVTPFMIALSAPFWSIQADRRGPKTMMTVVLSAVSLCILASAFTQAPWQLLILRTIQGLVGGFVPIGLSIVVSVTPEEKTSWSMGYFQAAMVVGIMVGPLIGGAIADTIGYRMPFFFFGSLSLLCLLAVRLFMPGIHRKGASKEKGSTWGQIVYFMKIPRVRIMTFMQFLCNFGITGIGPILPLYIKQMMGSDSEAVATTVGFIIFISGGCSALMSLNVGRLTQRFRPHKILVAATIFVGFDFIMQYFMTSVTGLGCWRAITGLGMGPIGPCTNTILAASVPPEKRSIVFGVVSSIFLMGNVAGPVCSGALARWFGYPTVFWTTAIAFFLAAGFIVYNFRGDAQGKKL